MRNTCKLISFIILVLSLAGTVAAQSPIPDNFIKDRNRDFYHGQSLRWTATRRQWKPAAAGNI